MLVDVGEVGPRPIMASATLRHALPYSDRAAVLSQCHDGSSGGSLLGVCRRWRWKPARMRYRLSVIGRKWARGHVLYPDAGAGADREPDLTW